MWVLVLSFSSILLIISGNGICPNGTVGLVNGPMCYKVMNKTVVWVEAEENCVQLGGHLATVPDAFTNGLLVAEVQLKIGIVDFYIGFNNYQDPKNCVGQWADGQAFTGYSNFQNSPKPGCAESPFCTAIDVFDGTWTLEYCTQDGDIIYSVCEIPNNKS
uniref:C-type lectin domain-containing protein n=1 Tax=Acrobeloides nanus TaxID=290746 RepID=A0A914CGY3_9BILA